MGDALKGIIRKRGAVQAKITRNIELIRNFDIENGDDIDDARALEKVIYTCEEDYTKFHHMVLELIADDHFEEQDEKMAEFETLIRTAKKLVRELIRLFPNEDGDGVSNAESAHYIHQANHQQPKLQPKLPELPLPTFHGTYEGWLPFKQMFNAMIDQHENLQTVQKFQYLRMALKGASSQMIEHLDVNEINYKPAWDILTEWYQNPRAIIDAHISALLDIKPMSQESAKELNHLIQESTSHIGALEALKQPLGPSYIVNLIAAKLDRETRKFWEDQIKDDTLPTWEIMKTSLMRRYRLLETIEQTQAESKATREKGGPTSTRRPASRTLLNNPETKSAMTCVVCQSNHPLFACDQFHQKSVEERIDVVRNYKLCFNCISGQHQARDCRSKHRCHECNGSHHTLIHKARPDFREEHTLHTQVKSPTAQVLLATAVIVVMSTSKQPVLMRAVLDSASKSSFITEQAAQTLGLRRQKENLPVLGLNEAPLTTIKWRTAAVIGSRINNFQKQVEFLIVPRITGHIPTQTFNTSNWKIPSGLVLADPHFSTEQSVDVLLGTEIFFNSLLSGQIRIGNQLPLLQETTFGWVVAGKIDEPPKKLPAQQSTSCHLTINDISDQVERFWKLESCEPTRLSTSEEEACERHFVATHTRDETGRYVLELPIRENLEQLGSTKCVATKRLTQLTGRLNNNPAMKTMYSEFMKEYETMGHMEDVTMEKETETMKYYLPHHGVYKEDSSTTKLRVVFNASQLSTSGLSLNDCLMVGGVVQDKLLAILMRFRKHKYVFTADIAKMYRQFRVADHHTDLQRIFWKDDTTDKIKIYRLTTVTYGTASAPYMAMRALKQLALDERAAYPTASQITLTDFYVDNIMTGSDNLDEALQMQRELIEMLKTAKMDLHKWGANHSQLLLSISEEDREKMIKLEDNNAAMSALGLLWNPETDEFGFNVKPSTKESHSKRTILSDIASLFDPQGVLGPITATAKMFMQHLWKIKTTWDGELPEDILQDWISYRTQLCAINSLRIPRQITTLYAIRWELHGFADASTRAYGACVYIRCLDDRGQITTNLLTSKSRISPLKTVSIPRLELCASVLLAYLVQEVEASMAISFDSKSLYSDSTIVLAWLNTAPHRLKTFVANRVTIIQEITADYKWKHVRSLDNPADVLSRGCRPEELKANELWWHGPTHFRQNETNWPSSDPPSMKATPHQESFEIELKPDATNLLVQQVDTFELWTRFNSASQLTRLVVYLKRFINNARKLPKKTGILQLGEWRAAKQLLVALAQQERFQDDLRRLKTTNQVSHNSKLRMLAPFIDPKGILRVGGRLSQAACSSDMKHPAILPNKHPFTRMILNDLHREHLHVGQSGLLAISRQQFWILRAKDEVRNITRQCISCFRANPRDVPQYMGDLPSQRVQPAQAFMRTGVDYAGPFLLKTGGPRSTKSTKAYIAVFVCFTTRAIHIELVSDLSTATFIAALTRFCSRRGLCSHLFSDNGTNFIGANAELKRWNKLLQDEAVNNYCLAKGITWNFIPPRSPHFGGLWEAGVKSIKTHMKRVLGNAHFTYEEMMTTLTQIEAILNSRPLTPISNDPMDFTALTPGHFLIGRELTALPTPDLSDVPQNRLNRWQRVQQTTQQLWTRWSKEFLTQLQERTKWYVRKDNLRPGLMVLLKEDNLPPMQWKLGRIIEVHPGLDQTVRVVTIKTASGTFKRATAKVCVLPLEDDVIPESH